MNTNGISTESVMKALISGRFAEKLAAQKLLEDPTVNLNRDAVRDQIIRLLQGEYSHQQEISEDAREFSDVRCWLLGSLGRLPANGEEPAKTLRRHVDDGHEPNPWARYWALTQLMRCSSVDLAKVCARIADEDPDPLPLMLANAILARAGDPAKRKIIQDVLQKNSKDQWAVLRAVRFVFLPFAAKAICACVENPENTDSCYDAIGAMGIFPPGSTHAEKAALVLNTFITERRKFSFWDAMRIRAIESLGLLKDQSSAPLLLEELTDLNPAVASAAAIALANILGEATTVARVLETLVKHGDHELSRFARGLREMRNQKVIVEELGVFLSAHGGPAQEYAQRLLSEIGGASAFEKLRSLTKSTERYLEVLDGADKQLRSLFDATVHDARNGFKLVIAMDVIVFFLGVGLLGLTAYLAMHEAKPFSSWSTWITGSAGVLATLYGKFIAQPRAQVEASVEYLSGMKAVFLGYLRQLRQTDQAYTRRILDDKLLTPEETKAYNDLIEQTMTKARQHLTRKPDSPKDKRKETPAKPDSVN